MKIYNQTKDSELAFQTQFRSNVKGINHRGYNSNVNSDGAPENTLPAYILSARKGFKYVETDVSFTSDGVAVLLHDSTIDRTSDGTGSIASLTFEQVRQYDFGSWVSESYAGTLIPSFEEFIALCRNLGLHPYIELKEGDGYTQAQITSIVDIVSNYGMKGNVTYISFSDTYLGYVKTADPYARLGLLTYAMASHNDTLPDAITNATALKTGYNEVFIDAYHYYFPSNGVGLCKAANLPLEFWCPNNKSQVLAYDDYVSGVTSDSLNAEFIMYEKAIE